MASLSLGPRINARTLPRIHRSIKDHCQKLTDSGCSFESRPISAECLVSAILSAYLDLEYKEQLAFIRPALATLEEELEKS